jgi:hypothetical protein
MITDDIIFLPLDIPPIPNKAELISAFKSEHTYVWWDEQILLGNKDYTQPFDGPESWNECADKFSTLVTHINEHLPFEYLSYVRLAHANKKVGVHVDDSEEFPPYPHHKAISKELKQHHLAHEPIGYRIILSGSRDTFYFCKHYDPTYKTEIAQDKTYVDIPNDTDFFLIKNYQQPHGVDINHLDHDRIVGFLLGKVNVAAHQDLIERSAVKYANNLLRKL